MRSLRRIDVLLNEKTGERFNINDIVQIKTIGGRELTGRLCCIETLELSLDTSKEYKYRTDKVKFEDIVIIKIVGVNIDIDGAMKGCD